MKYLFLTISLFAFTTAFAQPNREALALRDEIQFDLSFIFQHQNKESFSISFNRENNVDYILVNHEDCQQRQLQYKRPIADNYAYNQMLDYLQDIDITSFQPIQNTQNIEATFQVQAMINIQRTWTVNAFVFPYNPNNLGDEKQILIFIAEVLSDNDNDDCSKALSEKLNAYLE
jgi:hypothetical protein